MTQNIKICSMNVRGLANNRKRFDVFNWLKNKRFSIYCLQDVHVGPTNELNFRQDWGSEVILNGFTSESRGVAILFGENINYEIIEVERDSQGNLLLVNLKLNDVHMILIVLYGPNRDDPNFYKNIKDSLAQKENLPTIICGDWNLVLDFKMNTYGYVRENNTNARKTVEELIDVFDLVDTWRSDNPESKKYTWISSKSPVQMSRLDFFLVTTDIHAQIIKHTMQHGYRSDHSLIGIELNITETQRGKGFWKFNTSLLYDETYVKMIKKEIGSTLSDYTIQVGDDSTTSQLTVSSQMFFEVLKLRIRGKTIPYCSYKKKCSLKEEAELENIIANIEEKLSHGKTNPELVLILKENLDKYKDNLKVLRQPKLYATLMRAKAKIYEESEKPTKYFCNLEKRNYLNKLINRINTETEILTDQKSILEELARYYKNLYDSKYKKVENLEVFLKNENVKRLNKEDQLICEGPITEYELKSVLKDMKNGKSPGSDGFQSEFYKFFWKDIGTYVLNSLNEAFEIGELSVTQK